jgi:D-3-phosphoglycerate dehydrogenase
MELLKDKMIWVTGTCPPYFIDVEMIKNAAELKIVATPSTGSTHMDRKGIEKRNIKVCTIRSSEFLANIKASSEHTLALMLAMIRKIPFITAQAKHGIWREQERVNRTIEVAGKTIGIIGYGRIGGNLARYCNSLEMRVIVFDPFKVVKEDYITQVQSKAELLKKCDIVALCYHLDDSTNKSFTGDDFSIMQNGSYFINTARGELVDEDAMLDALKSGKLAAAAVDVITNESLPDKWNHPVIKYARENDNLIITPHTAGLTVDSESKAAMEIYKEIIKVL